MTPSQELREHARKVEHYAGLPDQPLRFLLLDWKGDGWLSDLSADEFKLFILFVAEAL